MNGVRTAPIAVLVLAVVLSSALPLAAVGTAGAQTETVVVQAALDDTPKTTTMSVVVTATDNGTIDVSPTSASRDGGAVEFRFEGWEDLDSQASGTSSSWSVESGHRYRITYRVTVREGVTEGRHSTSVRIDGPVNDGRKSLDLTVDILEPAFGSLDSQQVRAVFEERERKTVRRTVDIRNVGDGVMRPSQVRAEGVPPGISVSVGGLPQRISAGDVGEAELEIDVDPGVSTGTHRFTVTISDNLGNSRTFEVEVDISKPPRSVIRGGDVSLGDVLVGEERSTSIDIIETNGFTGLDGVSARMVNQEPDGTVRIEGLQQVSTGPGGSDSASLIASVDDDANQHNNLDWEIRLTPDHPEGISSTFQVTGRVIYPPYYGDLSVTRSTIHFDKPKSGVSSFSDTVNVTIPNDGDLEMDIERVSATAPDPSISASVVNAPATVPGLDQRTAQVELEANADAEEGPREFVVTVESAQAGREQIRQVVEIQQEPQLGVSSSTVEFGEVVITRSSTESTRISETLGYESISNLSIEKVAGPDQWIAVTERPTGQLPAGSEAPMVVTVTFDTNAELFEQYTWEYRVSSDGVKSRTITVRARAKPFSFEQIRQPLAEYEDQGSWQREAAEPTIEVLDRIEQRLKNGENVSSEDISTAFATARSTALFIESVESARQTIESDGHEAAQSEVVRAAAAYNSMNLHANSFRSDELQSRAQASHGTAEEQISMLLSEQVDYYQSQLDDSNTTLRESAQIKQQLARLALLQGDQERAERLRTESRQAFDEYVSRVETGNEQRQAAREIQESMVDSTTVVILDRWLVLNPAAWDTFESQSEQTLAKYEAAAEAFSRAGATPERRAVLETKSDVTARIEFARYSLYGATALYVLMFVGLTGHLTRGVYTYIRDSRDEVSGDFLLQ